MINTLLHDNHMSKYRLSKASGIPYMTINDICNGKANIKKCSVDTVHRIAGVFNMTMEDLLKPYMGERTDFELFKKNVSSRLEQMGAMDYVMDMLKNETIDDYYKRKWYSEAYYLLDLLDKISKEYNLPTSTAYDEIRQQRALEMKA